MSTVPEHIATLRARAETLRRIEVNTGHPWPNHLVLQEDRDFQFQAVLLCSVHLDELEALADGNSQERFNFVLAACRDAQDMASRYGLALHDIARGKGDPAAIARNALLGNESSSGAIRYDGLHEYAKRNGLDYNELCRVVRDANGVEVPVNDQAKDARDGTR